MLKVKLKSKRTLSKRFKISATGKLKHRHAYTSHLAYPDDKKHLRKNSLLENSDWKRLRKMLIK